MSSQAHPELERVTGHPLQFASLCASDAVELRGSSVQLLFQDSSEIIVGCAAVLCDEQVF